MYIIVGGPIGVLVLLLGLAFRLGFAVTRLIAFVLVRAMLWIMRPAAPVSRAVSRRPVRGDFRPRVCGGQDHVARPGR